MNQNTNMIPSLQVGGRIFTDVKNLITLYGNVQGAGNGNSTMRLPGASAGYTPSVGKAFRILAIRFTVTTGGAGARIFPLYANNDVGLATGTAFTTGIGPGGSANEAALSCTTGQNAAIEMALDFLVPNGKFPGISNAAGSTAGYCQIYGYEE